jgi:hypothetical protein
VAQVRAAAFGRRRMDRMEPFLKKLAPRRRRGMAAVDRSPGIG